MNVARKPHKVVKDKPYDGGDYGPPKVAAQQQNVKVATIAGKVKTAETPADTTTHAIASGNGESNPQQAIHQNTAEVIKTFEAKLKEMSKKEIVNTYSKHLSRHLGKEKSELFQELHERLVENLLEYFKQFAKRFERRGILANPEMLLAHNLSDVKVVLGEFDAAVCRCGKKMRHYYSLGCENRESDQCVKLLRELDSKSPACVCPVDPSTPGTCGVPVHLDLYTGKRVNGLQVPMPISSAGDDTDFLQLGSSTSMDSMNDEVEVQGLDEDEALQSWVKDTVRENAKVVDGVMVWEDTIPKEHGKYFRDHCDQLNWSVRKAGLTVEFKGLTFGVVADGSADAVRRRRLLGRNQNSGC